MGIAAKITAFIFTALINTVIAFFLFGALIIGTNGFPNSKSAEPRIILYFIWVVVSTILMSIFSVLGVWFLADKKKANPFLAALIAIIVFSIIGGVSIVIGWAAGLAFASYLFMK